MIRRLSLREIEEMRNETYILGISLVLLNHDYFFDAFLDIENLIAFVEGSWFYLSKTE